MSLKNLELIQFLIDNGAVVGLRDRGGGTVLHRVACDDDSDEAGSVLELLVRNGADVNAVNNDGMTVADMACHSATKLRWL